MSKFVLTTDFIINPERFFFLDRVIYFHSIALPKRELSGATKTEIKGMIIGLSGVQFWSVIILVINSPMLLALV